MFPSVDKLGNIFRRKTLARTNRKVLFAHDKNYRKTMFFMLDEKQLNLRRNMQFCFLGSNFCFRNNVSRVGQTKNIMSTQQFTILNNCLGL